MTLREFVVYMALGLTTLVVVSLVSGSMGPGLLATAFAVAMFCYGTFVGERMAYEDMEDEE